MKYGYFDDENKEYVILRPDTPAPWANYLGSPLYGAIISNNAGGYSFVKSSAKGRILRYRFNSDDKPGRYIYLRDNLTGDYWSASWQPVGKTEGYSSICRHGLGYTKIEADYEGIHSESTYYVPLNKDYEVWKFNIKNTSDKKRRISIFGYAEFTNDNDYEQDSVNLQYSQFISKTYFKNNKIIQAIKENTEDAYYRFFGTTAEVDSYTGDRRSFLGNYGYYSAPKALIDGQCDMSLNFNLNSCGALHSKLNLKPGEEREILYILGMHNEAEADIIISRYKDTVRADKEIEEVRVYWHKILNNFKVESPDENFNHMVNTWNAYQCMIALTWSRAASFVYCGHRNGYGYRDTVQDIQGVIHMVPELAKEKLIFMLSAQVNEGGGLPLVKYTHTPGCEDTPDDFSYFKETGHPSYRADDALWLFPTVKKYIDETGEISFLSQTVPYADKGEDTVYNHLKKAVIFSMNRMGANGLPLGLYADWNDCLRLGKDGESTFAGMQLYLAMKIMHDFAILIEDLSYAEYIFQEKEKLYTAINKVCFEEDRYIRGIRDGNRIIGSKKDKEASLWLNPQSWSVISGIADKKRSRIVLNSVYENLNTKYGARLMAPSFKEHGFPGALASVYNGSAKENGSVFLQPQGWLILAEAVTGNGNRAYEYYKESSPAHQNHIAEIREMEPYVYGQFTESIDSPFEGRSHVHWLTGTASTVIRACIEGILGIRPDAKGLLIEPALPDIWENVKIEKNFRGKKVFINISNKRKNGYKEVYLNDIKLKSNYISENQLKEKNKISIII
ncbi:MAG: N,N'-diacetylchitobiose phosphorylase [Tissierellia bacterium]|jgi:cellobiose phosphorylase|nr:N,N'-diacetylchitobiose phosphorylase [Tissierellia bacterium]